MLVISMTLVSIPVRSKKKKKDRKKNDIEKSKESWDADL